MNVVNYCDAVEKAESEVTEARSSREADVNLYQARVRAALERLGDAQDALTGHITHLMAVMAESGRRGGAYGTDITSYANSVAYFLAWKDLRGGPR